MFFQLYLQLDQLWNRHWTNNDNINTMNAQETHSVWMNSWRKHSIYQSEQNRTSKAEKEKGRKKEKRKNRKENI